MGNLVSKDPDSMTDEEFKEFFDSQLSGIGVEQGSDTEEESADSSTIITATEESADDGDEAENSTPDSEQSKSDVEEDSSKEETPSDTLDVDSDSDENASDDSTSDPDYFKRAYAQITAPFKANGKEIKVETPEEAIRLMQMGANYTKKMQMVQPYLQVGKTLEKHGLLSDPNALNYLIDLHNKNPEAISKLLQESKLDPLDIDTDKAQGYKPNSYMVSKEELNVKEVIEEIRNTPSGTKTLEIVNGHWDSASKDALVQEPSMLAQLNDHVASGVYDTVMAAVEKQRMLGNLEGKSDIEAYYEMGHKLYAENQGTPAKTESTTPQPQNTEVAPKKAVNIQQHKAKQSIASRGKGGVPARTNIADVDPYSLSEEEFKEMFTKLKV